MEKERFANIGLSSSNLCPDEKGTESIEESIMHAKWMVATYAPMKRGLKVVPLVDPLDSLVATYAPMKRGLKVGIFARFSLNSVCSNLCPDEKGTESMKKLSRNPR